MNFETFSETKKLKDLWTNIWSQWITTCFVGLHYVQKRTNFDDNLSVSILLKYKVIRKWHKKGKKFGKIRVQRFENWIKVDDLKRKSCVNR